MTASGKAAPGQGPQPGMGHPQKTLQPPPPQNPLSKTPPNIPTGTGADPAPPGQRFRVKPQHFGNSTTSPGSALSRTRAA